MCGAQLGEAETPAPAEGAAKPETETTVGISPNLAGFLCYLAGWITGIVFVLLEKKNTFVKFHAWQSIITFVTLTAVQVVLLTIAGMTADSYWAGGAAYVCTAFSRIVWLITVGLWIALMVLAYQGKMWKVPWAGDWAEKQASK
jgi:uncharacterized membrane protein